MLWWLVQNTLADWFRLANRTAPVVVTQGLVSVHYGWSLISRSQFVPLAPVDSSKP